MTNIEWTHIPGYLPETWNPTAGCTKKSEGCKECYAIPQAWIRMHNPKLKEKYTDTVEKLANGKLNWTGKINIYEPHMELPLKWKKPRAIFVDSMSDIFHENLYKNGILGLEFLDKLIEIIYNCPQHIFIILTKRIDITDVVLPRILKSYRYPENIWLGVSVENQKAADERIPVLLRMPVRVKLLSCEPLLAFVNLNKYLLEGKIWNTIPIKDRTKWLDLIDWVIVGGESGKHARPMHPKWALSIRDQCAEANVPFFFKQWGSWMPLMSYAKCITNDKSCISIDIDGNIVDSLDKLKNDSYAFMKKSKKEAGRMLDGKEYNEFPHLHESYGGQVEIVSS
jgi:protein gp37